MLTRSITGIVGIALAAYIVNAGGAWFGAAALLLALAGWHEYWRALKNIHLTPWYLAGMAATAFLLGCAWLGNAAEQIVVLTMATLCVLGRIVFDHPSFTVERAALTVLGFLYLGLPFSALLLLRFSHDELTVATYLGRLDAGAALVWVALIGTWASDTFAYFSGRLFGSHKLCPTISPGKTVAGFIGGILGTTFSLVAVGALFCLPLYHMAILGASVALVATLGDLVESSLKRLANIKDSGRIIPGHGGVLDRFDSILFTAPFVYYYTQIFPLLP